MLNLTVTFLLSFKLCGVIMHVIWVSYEQSRHLVIWNNSSRTCSWSCTVLQVSTYEGKSLDIDKVKLGHANLPNFQKQEGTIETWVCLCVCICETMIVFFFEKKKKILASCMLNLLSIAGIPDDSTKCTTWAWLSQGQEIFKGVCNLIETCLKEVAFYLFPWNWQSLISSHLKRL